MSKSILYAANTGSQTVLAVGTTLNFGSIVRRYGCNCSLSGGNAEITGTGYYEVDANVTFVAAGDGTELVQIYKDGVIVPGASATLTVASGSTYAITIPAVIKQRCNCTDTITVIASGVAGVVSNAAIVVEKE